MRGDCSIRIHGNGFTAEQIEACAARQGLLSIEIELPAADSCPCPACQTNPHPILSPQEILSLLDQARELGAKKVMLIEGQSSLYPHLRQIISELHARRMETELFVGGCEITTDFAAFLFAHRVDVAIDLSIENRPSIGHLTDAGYGRPEAPALAARIHFDAGNIEQVPGLWRFCRARGLEPQVQILTPGNNRTPQLPSPQAGRRLFEQLGEIDRLEFDRAWDASPALIGRSCNRHLFAVHVSACGTIYACVGVTIPLGNIRAEPLREIITLSEVLEDLRAFHQKVKEPCRTCSKTTDCYGCRGSAYQLTGDYLAGDQLCWKAESTPIQSLPLTINGLIPHGPGMRMVDELVTVGERWIATSFTVPADSAWIDENGLLDELACIEIIAQSFAASHGFHLPPEQLAAHKGLLLGVTNLAIRGVARAGDRLSIGLKKVTRFGDFGIVEGEIRHEDGKLIATGTVKLWRPKEAVASLM